MQNQRKSEVKSLSYVRLFLTTWTVAHQAPLSMGFSRQEYWNGVPLPSPFIGKTDAKSETPILWPPDVKNWLIGKDLDAGKDWRWEKGTTEDKMVGWHHWLNGYEFEQAPGVGEGRASLTCCSPWGRKELGTTEQLSWTDLNWFAYYNYYCHSVAK